MFGALIWTALCVGSFITAVVQALQGDWLPAIFALVLWVGLSNAAS